MRHLPAKPVVKKRRPAILRDGALELLRFDGDFVTRGRIRTFEATKGFLTIRYFTPFQRHFSERSNARYLRPNLGDGANLPYALIIWDRGIKVLHVEWAERDDVRVISYKPGRWEDLLPSEDIFSVW
jgi:hypothetical protein